jgi:hypothetical protein
MHHDQNFKNLIHRFFPSLKRRGKQQYLPLSALRAGERGLNGYVALRCVARLLGACKDEERLSRDADLPVEVGR